MAGYGKIYKKLWTNPKIRNLPDGAKLLWIYLLSSPHASCVGIYRISKNYAIADLKWDAKRFAKAFGILLGKKFIKYDEDAEVILIPSWFEYNGLTSVNQFKKAKSELSELPKTILAQEFNAIIDALPDGIAFAKGLAISMPYLDHKVCQANSETETETETEAETEAVAPPEKVKNEIPYEEIISHLNQTTGKLFRYNTEATQKLIRGRWKEGFRLDDFKRVHENKNADDFFIKNPNFLCPSTLYRPGHFEKYVNESPPKNSEFEKKKHKQDMEKWAQEERDRLKAYEVENGN